MPMVQDKYKMDAYLRTYTIDKDGNRTQPQKRLKGVFKYFNREFTILCIHKITYCYGYKI